jgi:hypothetical protein
MLDKCSIIIHIVHVVLENGRSNCLIGLQLYFSMLIHADANKSNYS